MANNKTADKPNNTPNNPGNSGQPQPNTENQTSPGSTDGLKQDAIALLRSQAQSAVIATKQADQAHVSQVLEKYHNQFEYDTDQISHVFETLMSPESKVAAGIVKAASRISDRVPEALKLPLGGYTSLFPNLPALSGFPGYFSASASQSSTKAIEGSKDNQPQPQSNQEVQSEANTSIENS